MLEHILKLKNLVDNQAAIEEPENDRDQILQLLGGLWADYNSIVASLTTREDEVSLHTVHSILLTHERLNLQNSVTEDSVISANIAMQHPWHRNHNKKHHNRNASAHNRYKSRPNSGRVPNSGQSTGPHNNSANRP